MKTNSPTTLRDDYFLRVLHEIAMSIVAGFKDREVADHLNALGLKSATGAPFNANTVRQWLKGLRNPQRYPSAAYKALCRLHKAGRLKAVQCRALLLKRYGEL